jgi:hypothetical protein
MQNSLLLKALDLSLAVWGGLVVLRFFAWRVWTPIFFIDRMGLNVALLGLCLALAAVHMALSITRLR